jgi:uncharacterized membrane protein YfcA
MIDAGTTATVAWWVWPLALFAVCFVLGVFAVPAGVGGGVLFVPIVSAFFPFHLDFVRGAGLLVALAGALSAGPRLLEEGLASLRLALPLGLAASIGSIAGALIGLALPAHIVQAMLGATVLAVAAMMVLVRGDEFPRALPDALAERLGMKGVVRGAQGDTVAWSAHRTPQGLALFAVIGVFAGLFGLGAGWANVPTLNLVMGVPIKVAAGTSGVILAHASSAAWVYLHHGAVLPMVAVPSMIGMMAGARVGARLLHAMPATLVRHLLIALLVLAGLRSLWKGLLG